MATIGSLIVNLGVATGPLSSGLKSASKEIDAFTSYASSKWQSLLAIGAGLVSIGALTAGFMSATSAIDDADDAAKRLGVSVRSLQGLQYGAGFAGIDASQLTGGIEQLLNRLNDAATKGGEVGATLDKLGLSAMELQNLPTDQAIGKIADALNGIDNPSQRAAAAMDLFGKSGQALLPFLANGSEGIAELMAEADKLGLTVSNEAASSVAQFNDSLDRLSASVQGAFRQAIVQAAPALTDLMGNLTTLSVTILPPVVAGISKVAAAITSVIPNINNLDNSTVRMIAQFTAAGAAVYVVLNIVPRVITAITSIIRAIKAMTAAQATALAFMGPKGWAQLLIGSAAALGAMYAVDAAFDSIEQSAANANRSVTSLGNNLDNFKKTDWLGVTIIDVPLNIDPAEFEKQYDDLVQRTIYRKPVLPVFNPFAGKSGELLKGLDDQVRMFGLTAEQLVIYKMKMEGANDAQIKMAQGYQTWLQSLRDQDEIDKLTESLQEQVNTFGMTAQQIALYKLALKGNVDDGGQIKALTDRLKELEQQKTVTDMLKDLQHQIATFGQTADQVKIFDLRAAGVDEAQLAQIQAAMDRLQALKDQAEVTEKAIDFAKAASKDLGAKEQRFSFTFNKSEARDQLAVAKQSLSQQKQQTQYLAKLANKQAEEVGI